jgi:hypothetical protein
VDHQVEHYIYVEGAGREDAEPVGLKEHGAAQTGLDREYGRIEALEMAGLENSAAALGARNQVVGLGECGGQGLFDEQVDAGIEQLGSDRVVVHGGHGYVGGVEPEVGREQSFHRRKDGNAVLSLNLGGARGVRLDGGDQSYALRGLFELAENAQVVAAEGTGSGDGNAQDGVSGYWAASLSPEPPSTVLRQRR